MDINIDDDIIIIQDKTPVNPQEAAPQINHNLVTCSTTTNLNKTVGSGNNESDNIINLDSSDDETGANNVQASTPKLVYTGPTVTQNITSNIITKSPILNTAIQKEIIDVDAEDTDALAPLRTFIDPTKNKTLSNTTNLISGNMSTATKRKAATIVSISKNNSSASYVRKTKNHTSQILDKHTENLNEPIHYYQRSINRRSYQQHSTSSQSIQNQIIPTLKPGFGVELADKSLSSTLKQLITIKDPTNRSSNNSSNVIKGDSNKPDILNSTNIADPNNQKLTYVGKIIRIPGQPCLIEDASGQIFRTDEFNANNSGEENNERSEENLYRNFLNNPYNLHKNVALRPEVPTSSDNILLNNILVQNSNTIVDGTPVIESQSNNMNIRHQGELINKNLKNTSKNSAKKVSKKQKTNSKNIKNQVKNLLQKQYVPVLNPNLPQESNNTLLDLNLNINDGRPPTSTSLITNTLTQSQNAVTSFKNTQPGYNVAFGLVLNVNDANELMNSYQTAPPNKFGSLNNVALDVSFNLNNPPKPATITRQEEMQNLLQQPAMELNSSEGILSQEVVNTAGQIYCCYLCSFKTTDIAVIGSHQCPLYSTGNTTSQKPVTSLNHLGCPNQDPEYQKQSDKSGYTGKSMRCCFCQFKTLDFELLKTHYSLGCTPEGDRSNVNTKKLKKYIRERIVSKEKMYCCIACSFKTEDFEIMNSHLCSSVNTILDGKLENIQKKTMKKSVETRKCFLETKIESESSSKTKNSDLQKGFATEKKYAKIYTCKLCIYKTTKKIFLDRHKCPIKFLELQQTQPLVTPNSDKPKEIPKICDICKTIFKDQYLFFNHLRTTHFKFYRKFGCYLCFVYFTDKKELTNHLDKSHGVRSEQIQNKEAYKCASCIFQSQNLINVKIHLDEHLEKYYSKTLPPWSGNEKQTSKEVNRLHECKLCGIKIENISVWLDHVCKDYSFQNYSKTIKCKLCYKPIFGETLKCDNSGCEYRYHLECINEFGKVIIPDAINKEANWFCIKCKNSGSNLAEEEFNDINWSMDFADKECLKEVEKQKIIITEIQKIKEENLAMKKEFGQIKNFIMKSKSTQMNNNIVKSVFNVLECFINADGDSND